MGTLDDGIEILLAEMGDGMELLNMIEEVGPLWTPPSHFPRSCWSALSWLCLSA